MGVYSSGLFDIFGELDIFIYAAACPNILMVKNSLDASGGKATLVPSLGEKLGTAFRCIGCTPYDGGFTINLILCNLTGGLIYPIWRSNVRSKFQIEGSILGDCLSCCLCGPLSVMQDSRELKRGLSGAIPGQQGI